LGGNWQVKRGGKRRITTEFHGIVKQGRFLLPPVQKQLRERLLASMKDGTRVKEGLVREVRDGTYKQLQTIFGLVINYIIVSFNDLGWDSSILLKTDLPTGVPVTKGLLKEYFYIVCPIEDEEGNRITLSKANIMQRMKFIDDMRNHAASQWGIDIPDPNPNWQQKVEAKNEGKYNRTRSHK